MIEIDILRSVLLDSDDIAKECNLKYGSKKITKVLSLSKLRNNFINLSSELTNELSINSEQLEKDSIIKKIHAKNISSKLKEHKVKHVFMKGVPLSNSFYRNNSDRIYTDADILIDLKDYKKFYEFLDLNKLKHNYNYEYLNRKGYTRSALEVIDSYINLDFHYRISENFGNNKCELSNYALRNPKISEGLPVPENEILLIICLYNALRKDHLRSGPVYIVDAKRIIQKGVDEAYLLKILNEFNLTKFYEETVSIISNLEEFKETHKQCRFIVRLFKNEWKRRFIPSKNIIYTQFMHLIDPEPYLNYVGGNLKKNRYFELIKYKLKRGNRRL